MDSRARYSQGTALRDLLQPAVGENLAFPQDKISPPIQDLMRLYHYTYSQGEQNSRS